MLTLQFARHCAGTKAYRTLVDEVAGMAIVQSKLGNNPLSRGFFSKTSQDPPTKSGKIQETSFLIDVP
jgi:hypothetical protein